MDVIGVGFGRTGTLSLKVALERLGFGPCLHMVPLLPDPGRAALWTKAATSRDDASLDAATEGYRSTVDWPGTFLWRELVARHPSAKVVLTVRDPRKWYESADNTIHAAFRSPSTGLPAPVVDMLNVAVWDGTFGGNFADRTEAIKIFEEHNACVRREIAPDHLLVFEVTEGWEPLCEFLGVPVPHEAFPRTNDTESFHRRRPQPEA
jgi:hypothetical protein